MRSLIYGLLFLLCMGSLRGADIAVVTIAYGKEYQDRVKLGIDNKRAYCDKHGYDFIVSENSEDLDRVIAWSKIPLILRLLENPSYRWVAWIDADTLIMNQDVLLEDLLYEDVNFFIGQDWLSINAGIFFIRNCEWSKRFLTEVYSRIDCVYHWAQEQTAIARVIEENPEFGAFAKIVPQRLFNSYAVESVSLLTSTYQPGDFLLHFAGIHEPDRLTSMFNKYSQEVLNDRKLITLDQYLGYYGFHFSRPNSPDDQGCIPSSQKRHYRKRLSLYSHIENILQIGLDSGHHADILFQTCKKLKKFISFDDITCVYTQPAADYFKRIYKEKFEFIKGDSALTVPEYASRFPNQKFDLIYIDGERPSKLIIQDILNSKKLAHPDTVLWVDGYWSPIQNAVTSLEQSGIIQIIDQRQQFSDKAGLWVEARYVFPQKKLLTK